MHLHFLNDRVNLFLVKGDSYQVHAYPDVQAREIVVDGEALREPLVHEWGAIIGDVVHNLRSALDHLVWQLTVAAGYTPPPNPIPKRGPGSDWKQIGFPIHVNPYPMDHRGNLIPWATSKEPKSLWGIRPSLRTDFEGLQPFNYGQNAPEAPLAILEELWNIDKHRHLHLTLFFAGLHDVTSRSPEFKFRILQKHPPGPFKGRAEIGRAKQVRGRPHQLAHMYMETVVTFGIAFEQGPPAYGGLVVEKLERLHDTVAEILVKFNSEFT